MRTALLCVSCDGVRHALSACNALCWHKNNFLSFSLRYAVDIDYVVRIIAILASWLCPRQHHTLDVL